MPYTRLHQCCNQRDHVIHVHTDSSWTNGEKVANGEPMRQGARKESKQTDERVERCNASQDQHGRHDQAGHEAEEEEVRVRGDAPAEIDYLEQSVHGLRHASSAWSIMFGETAVSGTLVT